MGQRLTPSLPIQQPLPSVVGAAPLIAAGGVTQQYKAGVQCKDTGRGRRAGPPLKYRIRIVYQEGAMMRDGIKIDRCNIMRNLEIGEIVHAYSTFLCRGQELNLLNLLTSLLIFHTNWCTNSSRILQY